MDCIDFMNKRGKREIEEAFSLMPRESSWRNEHCPATADTFIEWCFEKRCEELKNGVNILTEWRQRKQQMIEYLRTTVYDFQHYSRHDDSHAVSILEAVEMLLGQERVVQLSIGDLWLLLEAAYAHDVAMSLTYEELQELWENTPEFKEHIKNTISDKKDGSEAAVVYKVIDNLLKGERKFNDLEQFIVENPLLTGWVDETPDSWPLQIEKGLKTITAEYIRKEHALRVPEAMERLDKKKDSEIPDRMQVLLNTVCALHGQKFEDIFTKLPYCEKGFGATRMHPQFAACMLRMGDLLDIDNNRFNVYAIQHFGELPTLSELNYKKHKGVTHIAIRPDAIEAEAVSGEADVCSILNYWFKMIEDESNKLICKWNKIVPPELKGCLLNPAKCTVYRQNGMEKNVFSANEDSEFQVEKKKMIELTMGANLYRSRIDFIREYLQNALDASKMRLWLDIQDGVYEYSDQIVKGKNIHDLTPFDIDANVYEKYAVEVHVEFHMETQKIDLQIKDVGIGMDQECLGAISKVGGGWRGRKSYAETLKTMPAWLRPTGGFGIGIQSAFMVTDCVEIVTRGMKENVGRKIILDSPKNKGEIREEICQKATIGTNVKLSFDWEYILGVNNELDKFPKEKSEGHQKEAYECIGDKNLNDGINIFDKETVNKYIVDFLENYITHMIPGSFIPIKLIYMHEQMKAYKNLAYLKFPKLEIRQEFPEEKKTFSTYIYGQRIRWFPLVVNGKKFISGRLPINSKNKDSRFPKCIFWNVEDSIFASIEYRKAGVGKMRNYVCFKNVKVNRQKSINAFYEEDYDVYVDYEGFFSEQILKVHREEFNTDFQMTDYIEEIFRAYFMLLEAIRETDCEDDRNIQRELLDVSPSLIQIGILKKMISDTLLDKTETSYNENMPVCRWPHPASEKRDVPDDIFDYKCYSLDYIKQDFLSKQEMMHRIEKFLTGSGKDNVLFYKLVLQEEKESLKRQNKEIMTIPEPVERRWKRQDPLREKEMLNGLLTKMIWRMKEENKFDIWEKGIAEIWSGFERSLNDLGLSPDDFGLELEEQEQKETLHLLNCLEKDRIMYTDNRVVAFLEHINGTDTTVYKRYYFKFNRESDDVYVMLKRISKINVLTENEFYEYSYNRKKHESNVIENINNTYFPKLSVSEVPFMGKRRGCFLLSPIINMDLFGKLEARKIHRKEDNIYINPISFEDFYSMITKEYTAIIDWVFKHQYYPRKYTRTEIKKEYKKYIKKIYEFYRDGYMEGL